MQRFPACGALPTEGGLGRPRSRSVLLTVSESGCGSVALPTSLNWRTSLQATADSSREGLAARQGFRIAPSVQGGPPSDSKVDNNSRSKKEARLRSNKNIVMCAPGLIFGGLGL